MSPETQTPIASDTLMKGLNDAFNREVSTCLRYLLQAAQLQGVEWTNLRELYASEVEDELSHAQYLANKIVMLGGRPELAPDLEAPAADPHQMLSFDIDQELADVAGYRELAELAEREGLIELKLKMEDQAGDEARHAEALRRMRG